MKKFFIFLIGFLFIVQNISAYDYVRSNNKFGIHLAQPQHSDIKKTADLVNSSGGDWGYVTVVIQEDDRKKEKWQEIFDKMRENHLIPIIRIATKPEGASWRRPAKEEAQSWADFLNSLRWVVKNRYIILFNEPNHASEWGNSVDAYNYGEVAKEFAEKLKGKSPDFFIMIAGLDASAPTSIPQYLGEEYFLENMFKAISISDFERLFDGFSSHSYPNPGFSGSPYDSGRGTVQNYMWELNLLKNIGVNKNLPVFITETGWSSNRLSYDTIASYFKTAYESVWLPDQKIVAVTPFVLDYQGEPFLNFSWKKFQSDEFYPQYFEVQSLTKQSGDPEQIDIGEMGTDLPKEIVANSNYRFKMKLKNNGQAVWDKQFGYEIALINQDKKNFEYFFSDIKHVSPTEEAIVDFVIKTNSAVGDNSAHIVLKHKQKIILENNDWKFEIVPLPSLEFRTTLYPKLTTEGNEFEIQIFDENQDLIVKKNNLKVYKGVGYVDDIQNIIPGRKYRIVLLNPHYLPRQSIIVFNRGINSIKFKRMFPLDLNMNGHLDWGDLGVLIQNPELMRLFFP